MPDSADSRFLLAAALLLALLVGTFEVAVRWPARPLAPAPPVALSGTAADVSTLTTTDTVALESPAPPVQPSASPPPANPSPLPANPPPAQDQTPGDNRPVYERGSWAARRPRLLHRYVGTVGGQAATALLEWQHPDSVTGSFYLHRGGPEYRLGWLPRPDTPAGRRAPRWQGRVLGVEARGWWAPKAGQWLLRGRPGATLTATWRGGPSGQPQTVRLREDYAGGVRLGIQTWRVHGRPTGPDQYGNIHSSVPEVTYDFMHLPDPLSVAPALRPILSPDPARRRWLLREGGDYDCITSYTLSVRLNDFGLFSYCYEEYCDIIGGAGDEETHSALLDLRAGRWLSPESQLVPHYEVALARLLAGHLLRDDEYWQIRHDSTWRQQLIPYLAPRPDTLAATTRWLLTNVPVSAAESVLTGAGLDVPDWRGYYVQAFPRETFTWFIPYHELRPLVRPGTPLARMLQARGIN